MLLIDMIEKEVLVVDQHIFVWGQQERGKKMSLLDNWS